MRRTATYSIMLLLLSVSAQSCRQNLEDIDNYDISSIFEHVDIASDSLQSISFGISFCDYVVWANNVDAGPLLTVYNTKSSLIKKCFMRGRGPGEGLGILNMGVCPTDSSTFYVYDMSDRLLTFSIDRYDTVRLNAESLHDAYWTVMLSNGFVYSPYDGDMRYAAYDFEQSRTNYFGHPDVKSLSATLCNSLLQEVPELSPDGTKLALFSGSGVYYKIYDISDISSPQIIIDKTFIEPKIDYDPETYEYFSTPDDVFGFEITASDRQYIYAAYQGSTALDYIRAGRDAMMARKIMVIDWSNGETVCFINYNNHPIVSIACNDITKMFYLVYQSDNGDNNVVSCNLQNLHDFLTNEKS